jgi:transcriptional regulator with XRE-family HTH domain
VRRALGLRQDELAERLDVQPGTISRWEHGHSPVPRTVVLAMRWLVARASAETAERGPGAS